MAGAAVRVDGLAQTIRQLERFGVSTDDLKEAFGSISRGVVTEAGTRISVDTGAAKATIRAARTKNKAVVRAGNTTTVVYAGVLNYQNPGDEFLTGPANENPEEKAREIERNLEALITRYRLR
jgi:CII-binding regulator of phage lambda lysogenization HflD